MSSDETLEKKWKHALAGIALAAASPVFASKGDEKPSLDYLHHELQPIAHLESSGGKFVEHQEHSKGPFHTAVGAVGLKPITAHEEYLKSTHLQKLYPNLHDVNNFLNELKTNNDFYGAVASAHWNRLKRSVGNDSGRAAFAWRWGIGKAKKTPDDVVNSDSYVQKFKELSGLNKSEELDKKISDLKPGKKVERKSVIGAKVYNYDNILNPNHIRDGYSMVIHDRGDGYNVFLHDEDNNKIGQLFSEKPPSPVLKNKLKISESYLHEDHRGKKLGQAMYEALYAHAKHRGGVTHIYGDIHSTMASRTHQALASKHGLEYRAIPNYGPGADWETRQEWQKEKPGPFDAKYRPYQFELKQEDTLDGGLADNVSSDKVSQRELKDGISHEMEHTDSKTIAREIAMDHLVENPRYYTKLKQLEKSIASIKPGVLSGKEGNNQIFDYSHVLKPEQQKVGYSLHIEHEPDNKMTVWVKHPNSFLEPGVLNASFDSKSNSIVPETADIHPEHRNKGLGQAMYEALYAHGLHNLKATKISGDIHSTAASRVHQKLSQKHGMDYKPELNPNSASTTSEEYDQKFLPYNYALKYENFNKQFEDWLKMPKKKRA